MSAIPTIALITCMALGGCTNAPPTTLNDVSDVHAYPEETADWLADELPSTLQQALKQANPFVYNGKQIPAELAIQIVRLSNEQSDWKSLEATRKNISVHTMSTDQYARYSLELLKAWNQRGEPEKMESWLNSSKFLQQFPLMDTSRQAALSLARADLLTASNKPLESARERVFIHDFIEGKETRDANLQAILQNVISIEEASLQQALRAEDDKQLKGWLEFALISRNIEHAASYQQKKTQVWKSRWKNHPANHFIVPTTTSRPTFFSTLTFADSRETLGIFLPLSGKLAIAGKAVRDGILGAYYQSGKNLPQDLAERRESITLPTIKFYDTAAGNIEQLYNQARADGVTAIIGPLQKNLVQALFTMPTELPILTLNFISETLPPPDNIVQFGLATEDEAHQIAHYAYRKDYKRPLVIVSNKDWSQRAAREFNDTWRSFGKGSAVVQPLSAREQFSTEVSAGLGLPASHERHKKIQKLAVKQLEYRPRRRQDIDYIVLFANSSDAKTINPLLDYHYAAGLPVFASSHVFNATDNTHQVDLNGIIFSEIPWLLEQKHKHEPGSLLERKLLTSKTQQRLYAMGQDAFHIYARVDQLKQSPLAQWRANTGKLSIRNQRVVRELPLAQFKQGGVVELED